jgi:hypothetical protein
MITGEEVSDGIASVVGLAAMDAVGVDEGLGDGDGVAKDSVPPRTVMAVMTATRATMAMPAIGKKAASRRATKLDSTARV